MGYRIKNYVININIVGCHMIHVKAIYSSDDNNQGVNLSETHSVSGTSCAQYKYSCDHEYENGVNCMQASVKTRHVHVK